MSFLNKYKQLSWATDDNFVPFHHHSGDDNKNFLVDREKNEIVNFNQANDRFHERTIKRRAVLCGLGATSMIAIAGAPRYAWAAEGEEYKGSVIINIFLRGAMDGYYAVGPYLDERYLKDRPTLKSTPDNGIDIGQGYALHKSLGNLKKVFDAGDAAFAAGVGTFGQSRSHFDAQAAVERSAPVQVRSGWIARYLSSTANTQDTRFRAFSHKNTIIGTQQDSEKPSLTVKSFKDFTIPTNYSFDYDHYLTQVFGKAGGKLGAQATETIAAISEIKEMSDAGYTPANGAQYNNSSFGQGMKEIAQFIKSGKGLEAASIDFDNWDTHDGQETWLTNNFRDLGDNIQALYQDLGSEKMKNVVILTQSEFGRTITENGAAGTDHGLGNFMMIVGGGINGGKVYGDYPDLTRGANKDRDAPISIDYRDIISEILVKKFKAKDKLDEIFPDYQPQHIGLIS